MNNRIEYDFVVYCLSFLFCKIEYVMSSLSPCMCIFVNVLIFLFCCIMNLWQNDFNFEKRDWMTVQPKELLTGSQLVRNDGLFPFKYPNEGL